MVIGSWRGARQQRPQLCASHEPSSAHGSFRAVARACVIKHCMVGVSIFTMCTNWTGVD